MPIQLATAHERIILDACCIINLGESGRMADILASLPRPGAVAAYVREEEVLHYDLQPLVAQNLLRVVDTLSPDEEIAYVNLAVELDDGEAVTGAIAAHRGWAIATDERKAIRVFTRRYPHLQLLSTPELVEHWVVRANPTTAEVRSVLQNIQIAARYMPHASHPLHGWWQKNIS